MTAEKFEATLGTKKPRTEALRQVRETLMATMGDCADAINHIEAFGKVHTTPGHSITFYQGKMDGFASCLALLETLGPQIEEEAREQGLQEFQKMALEAQETARTEAYERGYQLGCETPRKGADR